MSTMSQKRNAKVGKKVSKKASLDNSNMDDHSAAEEAASSIHAATPAGPAHHSDQVLEEAVAAMGSVSSTTALTDYLKAATVNFERMMEKAVRSMVESIQKVERALEFEGVRINELEKKNKDLEGRLERLEKAYDNLNMRAEQQDQEINKAERYSKRSNFRVVGIPEPTGEQQDEDCAKMVEEIIKAKFNLEVRVERAHRDGKKNADRPRHVLVKTLLYRDKALIMKNARHALQDERFYFIDDMTKRDLEEKKKHAKEVQDLYTKGTKLRFYAGQWRGNGGVPYFSA